MRLRFPILAMFFVLGGASGWGEHSALQNPTQREYRGEVVRLMTPVPGAPGSFIVKQDGAEVPYQVEQIGGTPSIWVCADFAPGAKHTYEVAAGKPKAFTPLVMVKREGDSYLLDNGQVAVKVPAVAGNDFPGPVSAVRLPDGAWVGGSFWHTTAKLKRFTATVIGDGTVLGKVRLRYDFEGMAGFNRDIPAFAEVEVSLGPGWQHAQLAERHEMARDDYWEFDASKGWRPTEGVSKPFSAGAGSGEVKGVPPTTRPLTPGALPLQREELFLNLFPRWNQHYKDGWFFAANDSTNAVGAIVVFAGQWVWPHENSIQAVVKPSGDYAGLRAPTWKGQRVWWLVAGPKESAGTPNIDYVTRYAFENLDKLNHDFVLEWPGKNGSFSGMNFYDGGQVNPTGGIRGAGKSAIANAAKLGNIDTLTRVQTMFHPDAYGNYWLYWSPENPNFFTDFTRVPIAMTANLREHPQFERFRKMAEMTLREDMYHSVTMPSGAGQECPGYLAWALKGWSEVAPVCKQYLGFDPTTWDRYKAAERFLNRITYPDGNVRRFSPLGDSHPDRQGGSGMRVVDVPADEVKRWKTEELQGLGVVFTNKPGTPQETYLSFKAGPNRGHYHGDQLAFHYCANARPIAVDHHCSYHPRAGQEHMHNRLAFFTDDMPYANMDGYERLIAFKPGADVDIAVGQVESDRLRHVQQFPPELWHEEYPQVQFGKPLVYRRTMVFMKGGAEDYFVIRDQYQADRPLHAAFCLHTYGDAPQQHGQLIDFGKLSLFCATPQQFAVQSFPWKHDNGGEEKTEGIRLEMTGQAGEFITVLYPGGNAPTMVAIPGGVKVGTDEVVFGGGLDENADTTYVTVTRNGKTATTLVGRDIDLDRSQGEVGLFVPDAGYPFGEIPDWLAKQRAPRPDWAK